MRSGSSWVWLLHTPSTCSSGVVSCTTLLQECVHVGDLDVSERGLIGKVKPMFFAIA